MLVTVRLSSSQPHRVSRGGGGGGRGGRGGKGEGGGRERRDEKKRYMYKRKRGEIGKKEEKNVKKFQNE